MFLYRRGRDRGGGWGWASPHSSRESPDNATGCARGAAANRCRLLDTNRTLSARSEHFRLWLPGRADEGRAPLNFL